MKSRHRATDSNKQKNREKIIQKRKIAIILVTTAALVACGVFLRGSALLTPAGQAAGTAAAGTAAAGTGASGATAGTAKDGSDGTVTQNWDGTGLTAVALDPAAFSPGACVAFTSGGATRGETVFLDAGHGGIDPGGMGQASDGATVTEAVVNLKVALDTMRILTSAGYRVVLSRTAQTTVVRLTPGDTDGKLLSVTGVERDIAARDACANDAHANLLTGIYMNAGSAGEAGSVTVYDAVRPFAAQSKRFAGLLQTAVLAKLNAHGYGIPNGGVNDDSGYGSTLSAAGAAYGHLELLGPASQRIGFTTPSKMPGALIEPLFLTDPFEATIAASSGGQELIAAGIANAVEQYFARA